MITPLTFDPARHRGLKVLCLGAHADDLEIGCGGTILRWAAEIPNLQVRWVVFSANPVRKIEARRSAKRVLARAGKAQVTVASHRESFFPEQWSTIKRRFEQVAKGFQPDVVFTHYREDRHQDHRVLSDLAWNTFRNHLILEYEIPKYDGDLGRPNTFVSLSAEICATKIQGILKDFKSQRSKHWFSEETFRGLMRLRGMECASTYAEAFHVRKMVLM